ncbi:MAG TPA: sugar phosphate nucleotidyltransferase [Anaerolineaceae bacterium]|nr:sugar phosphate nucleotidyltransferase [Anaerolineaceae bacterium]
MSSKNAQVHAVVLAGGKGTRLAPYTRIIPKPLMPIGDMPILEIMLRQMKRAGIRQVTLTTGYLDNLLRLFFLDGRRLGLKIDYVREEKPLGTSGPLANVKGLTRTFLVTNGDVLTDLDFAELIAYHQQQGAIATIATHKRKVTINLGVVDVDKDNTVTDYLEKPDFNYLVSMGLYVFEPRVLNYIAKDEYLDFPDLVRSLIAAGEKVNSFIFKGYWEDLGRPDDYERASADFERNRSQFLPE